MNRRHFLKNGIWIAGTPFLFLPRLLRAQVAPSQQAILKDVAYQQAQSSAPAATAFLTSVTGGTPRSNFTGDVGMWFTTGSQAMTVTELGTWVISGNSATHTILMRSVSGCSLLGSVSISTSGAPTGWKYATLGSPIALSASTNYDIFYTATSGGDQWLDQDCTVATTAAATCNGTSLGSCSNSNIGLHCYAAPNFKYTIP